MKTSLRLTGSVLTFLVLAGLAAAADPVEIKVDKNHIDFLAGGKLVARYNKGPDVAKPYFWPVMAPGDVRITRSWPMEKAPDGGSTDHIHQKSLYFCHGEVHVGDAKADFWSEAPGHGRIVCTEVGEPKLDKNHASIVTKNEWRTAGGKKLFDETRTLHLYTFDDDGRLIVFDCDLQASTGDILFGDTKEGSFGVRVNDQLRENKKGGKLVNALGKSTMKECWGQLAPWCDYSGKVDGKEVGLTVFDDPKNPAPAAWHARDYGLLAANAFGRNSFPSTKGGELFKIAKGKDARFRYGVFIHKGDAKTGNVEDHYKQFVKER